MYHYLFNLICFQFRILTVPYFLDECTLYEIDDILECIPYMDRNLWETSRLQAYITAKSNFKGIHSMNDICKFKWENESDIEENHITEISNEDIERLRKIGNQFINAKKVD